MMAYVTVLIYSVILKLIYLFFFLFVSDFNFFYFLKL